MGELGISKAHGKENPADLMTKHLPKEEIVQHCKRMNVEFGEGRAKSAPTLNVLKAMYELEEVEDEDGHGRTLGMEEK